MQGLQDAMVKSGWIFSLPLGSTDVAQIPDIPKYLYDAAHGGTPDDPKKSALRSLGMAGLAGAGGLFGLGFAGMGIRDLGRKMSILSRVGHGLEHTLRPEEQAVLHQMRVPAYKRFSEYMGNVSDSPWLSYPAKGLGYAAGLVAHPFNKAEDWLTGKLVQGLGPGTSSSISHRLYDVANGQIFDNPAVRAMSSPLALAPLVAGDMYFAPYHRAQEAGKTAYLAGFGDMVKTGQFQTAGERISEGLGGGLGGGVGEMVAYSIPMVGTGLSLYDAGAQAMNMLSPGKSLMERVGHGASALGNVTMAGAGLVGAGGLARAAVKGVGKLLPGAADAAKTLGPRAQGALGGIRNYLGGNTAWQKALKAPIEGRSFWNPATWPTRMAAHPMVHGQVLQAGGDIMSGMGAGQAAEQGVGKGIGAYGTRQLLPYTVESPYAQGVYNSLGKVVALR
jgi:hypothetical protein